MMKIFVVLTAAWLSIVGVHAASSPEFLCDLDGKPVSECVSLLKAAAAESDTAKRDQLSAQASEVWKTARTEKDANPGKALLPPISADDAKRPALEQYRGHLAYGLLICKTLFRTAILEQSAGDGSRSRKEFSACTESMAIRARELYDLTSGATKKAGAKAALKEVHIEFVAAIEGIRPSSGELSINYSSRQAALEGKLSAAWARFDLER